MLKRIFSAVGVVLVGFIAVVVVVIWQINTVIALARHQGEEDVPAYRQAVAITEETARLEKEVAGAFLSGSAAGIIEAGKNANAATGQIEKLLAELSGPRFAGMQDSILPSTAATNAESRTVSVALKKASEDLAALKEATVAALVLASQKLAITADLAASRDDLSRVFRKAFTLGKADEKAFASVSRGVMTTLYSASTRDLNFAGRTKFDEGITAFEKSETPEIRAVASELKTQFAKTLQFALQASASADDFALFARKVRAVRDGVAELRTFSESEFEGGQSALRIRATQTVRVSLAVSIITIVVGLIVAGWIARGITRRIGQVVTDLDESAGEIAAAASQLGNASGSVAEGASQQAAAIEETSASLEEITSMVKRNADSSLNAKSLSAQTREAADVGARQVDRLRNSMAEIKTSSDEVAKIVKSIEEFAFQTNILALNAAVEAARAGSAGAGFSVVADEVRALAQRSAQAAYDTASKIEMACSKTAQGVAITQEVEANLKLISERARSMDTVVAEIASACSQQAEGISQINTGVAQMDKVTQSNAASAEESAAASTELTGQARGLRAAIQQLLALVGGTIQANTSSTMKTVAPSQTLHPTRPVDAQALVTRN